jgi:hypothetical protein
MLTATMTQTSKDPGAQVMFILWSAMLISQVLLFAVGQIVPPSSDQMQPSDLEIMSFVFVGLGVSTALASALAVPMMFRGQAPQAYQTMMIMRFALAETPTIFGLVLAMMGSEMPWVYMLTGLGIVAHLTAFPTQRDREAFAKK